jgi:predicted lipid-binding transport protein (Tim44 family)
MDNGLFILVMAVVAGVLLFRLWNVLGRRTGAEERRPNPLAVPKGEVRPNDAAPADNVVPIREREDGGTPDAALAQIKIADPSFTESRFLHGVRAAFKMIVEGFAKGDTATLRPLLSDDLYDQFSESIRERLARGDTLEEEVEKVDRAEIVSARMDGRTAYVVVRISSRQKTVTRNAQGQVIEGDPDTSIAVEDIWTFARNTRAADPNWTLVETRSPD